MNISTSTMYPNFNFTVNNQQHLSARLSEQKKHEPEENKSSPSDITTADLDDTMNAINEKLHVIDKKLEYSIHQETNRLMIKIIDPIDKKLIKEIPSKELLDIMAKIQDFVGLMVDERI